MSTPYRRLGIRAEGLFVAALCLVVVLGGCAANGQERAASPGEVRAPVQAVPNQSRMEQRKLEREARNSALRDLVGSHTGSYLFPERSLFEQINLAAGIPDAGDGSSRMERELPGGFKLEFGCRQHNCPEKGAVLLSEDGRVVRAALISFKCQANCEKERTLTIFKRASDESDPASATLDDLIKDWAQSRAPGVKSEVVELR